VHEAFWGFVVFLWPLSYIGNLDMLVLLDFWLDFIKNVGVYGAYEVLLILIILGSVINIDRGWDQTLITTWLAVSGYFLLIGFSSWVSLSFQPMFHEWFLEE